MYNNNHVQNFCLFLKVHVTKKLILFILPNNSLPKEGFFNSLVTQINMQKA